MYKQARRQAGRTACPSVVIMDGQSVKTKERGGIRGFDAHKCVKGRKRHILVDTFGLLIACRVQERFELGSSALCKSSLARPSRRTVVAIHKEFRVSPTIAGRSSIRGKICETLKPS